MRNEEYIRFNPKAMRDGAAYAQLKAALAGATTSTDKLKASGSLSYRVLEGAQRWAKHGLGREDVAAAIGEHMVKHPEHAAMGTMSVHV